jgi:hypothetical protein
MNAEFESDHSIEGLIRNAQRQAATAGNSGSVDIEMGRASTSLQIAQIRVRQDEQQLTRQQIELARRANELNEKLIDGNHASRQIADQQLQASKEANSLTERLIASNEEASRQNDEHARLMNSATEQLAKSTNSLKRATWALVAFTAVQALIAFAELYVSMHPTR